MSDGADHELTRLWSKVPTDWDEGLSERELSAAETRWGFRFPPDLRELLATGLPTSPGFPNWRTDELVRREQHADGCEHRCPLDYVLAAPLNGLLFNLEHNGLWLETWGARPAPLDEAALVLKRHYARAPTLVPVFSHRYIPDRPSALGNPVLSVVQSDIIVYGEDLESYLRAEFFGGWTSPSASLRNVEFWSEFLG